MEIIILQITQEFKVASFHLFFFLCWFSFFSFFFCIFTSMVLVITRRTNCLPTFSFLQR